MLRHQCPVKSSLCCAVTRGIFPYSSALERWSIQDLFKAAPNILLYELYQSFSRELMSVSRRSSHKKEHIRLLR